MPDHRNLALTLAANPDPEKIEKALDEAFAQGASVRHAECSHGFATGLKVGLGIVDKTDRTADNSDKSGTNKDLQAEEKA